MAEPLDPAALGVASALKSFRTRTGLREERLHGTELALDMLTRLESVKVLVDAGESPERAIVRAVRAAAGTLEATLSIVADASLGLELSADLIPGTDLYAQDLGQRREAVLRNWDRLHELRSAPLVRAPSPRALRLELESEALTALAVALTSGVGSGQLAQTAAGPDGPRTRGTAGLRRGTHQDAALAAADHRAGGGQACGSAGGSRPVGGRSGAAVGVQGSLA
jgi:hypothetical protein